MSRIIPYTYHFALGLLLISLPFSNYFISVAQFMLAGTFIVDGISKQEAEDHFRRRGLFVGALLLIPVGAVWVIRGLGRKMRQFFHRENAPAWVLTSIFLLHVAGLAFTTDFQYAMKDLRIKLPILLLPLILSTTGQVTRRAFRFLMYLFIAAVVVGTFISTWALFSRNLADSRDSSLFISHIRFSMLIDIAIFAIAYLVLARSEALRRTRILLAIAGVWLVGFLLLAAYMTGLVIFLITSAILLLYLALDKRGWIIKVAVLAGLAAVFIIGFIYIKNIRDDVNRVEKVDISTLEKTTRLGNPYWHNLEDLQVENGHYVWHYVATQELKEAWNQRSDYDFDGKDQAGQEIKYTLIRFLTSKGYRKDAAGVALLTNEEVALVEGGTASIVYVEKPKLYVRIYKIFWEYNRYQATRNPSGHSVMQRLEFWRAAIGIIRDNWLTGVGTGDVNNAFQEQYEKMDSQLTSEFRWRAHNQFLAITAQFGIFGLAWFLFALIYPAARLRKFPDYFYLSFFIIILLSMLTEDTLETQVGVTQFAFFSAYYLFAKKFIDIT